MYKKIMACIPACIPKSAYMKILFPVDLMYSEELQDHIKMENKFAVLKGQEYPTIDDLPVLFRIVPELFKDHPLNKYASKNLLIELSHVSDVSAVVKNGLFKKALLLNGFEFSATTVDEKYEDQKYLAGMCILSDNGYENKVGSIIKALEDPNPTVVCLAMWFLGEINHVGALSDLNRVKRYVISTSDILQTFISTTDKLEKLNGKLRTR